MNLDIFTRIVLSCNAICLVQYIFLKSLKIKQDPLKDRIFVDLIDSFCLIYALSFLICIVLDLVWTLRFIWS